MQITARARKELLLGLDEQALTHVTPLNCKVHRAVETPLLQLCDSADAAGFRLTAASSFRSFERQLWIWNAKATGQRQVMDDYGQPLDMSALSDLQKVYAILRWSALPGASRHHWGTDLDVFDSASVPVDYRLQLTCEECVDDGPFAAFHQWLTTAIAADKSFGFFRPYGQDDGGVAPEPWHLSYAPLANEFARQRTESMLREQIELTDIALKATILTHFSEIFERYIALPQ